MSKSVKSVPKNRTPQWKLDLLILKDKLERDEAFEELQIDDVQIEEEQREEVQESKHSPRPVLFAQKDYDTLHPEETLRLFCGDVKDMLARYEGDKTRYEQLEDEMQDLLHFIEMAGDKDANTGYKLYKRLAEVRRERRDCQNELTLLQPVYDNFKNSDLLNLLSRIQGNCRAIKQQIQGRAYSVRTDVLEPFLKITGR